MAARAVGRLMQQRGSGHAAGIDHELVIIGAGEQEQVVGQPAEPVGLLDGGADRGLQRWTGGAIAGDQLELGAQHGQRRAQLMAGVRHERALPLHRSVNAGQHLVHGA